MFDDGAAPGGDDDAHPLEEAAMTRADRRPEPARTGTSLLAGLTVLMSLAGCSGADPKDVESVAAQYEQDDNPLAIPVTEKQAECRAEVYLSSDLSEGALQDVKDGKPPSPRNEDDAEVLAALAADLTECL